MEIRVISAHGDYSLAPPSQDMSVADVCLLNRIPVNSVAVYGASMGGGAEVEPVADTMRTVRDLSNSYSCLIIRPDRNISYESALPTNIRSDVSPSDVASYFFRARTQEARDDGHLIHKGFSVEECRAYVDREVLLFVDRFSDVMRQTPSVVGVSGGGDSNALLGALLNAGIPSALIHPVMIMGVPDWDKGRDRAESLCSSYGLTLKIYEASEVSSLLGLRPGRDWVSAFESTYPGVDVEVIGTLAIRRVLSAHVRQLGQGSVVTGLNLEDLLADALMRVMEGKLPIAFPKRHLDGVDILYPLYRCPKRILDGCHPKYSLENYQDRYPSHLNGRAITYFLSQSVGALLPGVEFDLLRGLERLSTLWDESEMTFNPVMGFSTLGGVSLDAQAKWREYQIG